MKKNILKIALIVILQSILLNINAQSLEKGFVNPPDWAKPWVYWFWLNGNLSKNGITADLEAMKRAGIGGVLIMEVDQGTPKGAYVFGSTEWRDLFNFMLKEANRLGLKVNMNNDAGWCGSGGPWMTAEKSMQKIVWTETVVQGGKKYDGELPQPTAVNDYYEDIIVLAIPTPDGDDKKVSDYNPEVKSSSDDAGFDGKKLIDNDLKSKIELSKPTPDKPQYFEFIFPTPFTSHSMTIRLGWREWPVRHVKGMFQISDDGMHFKTIKEFEGGAPSISFEYNELTARWYRLTFTKLTKEEIPLEKISITEVEISNTRISNIEQKALFLPPAKTIVVPTDFQPISSKYTVQSNQVLNITDKMKIDGTISWNVPKGKWTIIRIGHTTTGKFNHPAPEGGLGYECDKLSKDASTMFFNGLIQKLAVDSKPLVGKSFISTHIDSWEVGSQNWTPGFYEEFEKRRGYDPIPYLPVMMGIIIDNNEVSERFLWDLRTTISEMMLENYVENISNLSHQNGLKLSIEAYVRCLTDEMTYAGRADEPMAEFLSWVKYGNDFSCTEMASAAHVYGKKILGAEAFTARKTEMWLGHPANIKDLGDWAFCEGINRFVIHRYAMQPYENIKPGIAMGPWGLHYERTQTWWEQSVAWHQYLTRCQYLLQQGLFVADICYLAPEAAPQTWIAPYKRDSAKYNFDGCPSEVVLTRMSVKDGRIILPNGMNYKLLVLSSSETMTPKLLKKIKELAEAGATIVGAPPKKALGLTNYPQSDEEVKKLAAELWGKCDGITLKENRVGKGRVVFGKTPEEVLAEMKIGRDFSSEEFLRYTHRNINGTDVYFVANPKQSIITTTCQFRMQGMQPEIWNPMTGEIKKAAQYEEINGFVKMPVTLDPAGSVFVIFRPENKMDVSVKELIRDGEKVNIDIFQNKKKGFEMNLDQTGKYNLTTSDGKNHNFGITTLAQPLEIKGPWEVSFMNGMGAPSKTTFGELISWSDHQEQSIKYYSGAAVYRKNISISKEMLGKNKKLKLDLGKVEIMSEVKVNGKLLGILWKAPYCLDITDALKIGTNTIELKVVNLWVNRLIGDEQLPDSSERNKAGSLLSWPKWITEGKSNPTDRYSFTTWKLWKKDSPLVESGLLGPVRIISEEHIIVDAQEIAGKFTGKDGEVKIIQLEPLHSHAAVVQREQLNQIDTNVYVYAPERSGLDEYFHQINSFNTRKSQPTRWNEVVYIGKDFLEKMVQEKKGNVVVLAGNNRIKIDYIEQSIQAGFNVCSDKPMVINKAGFERLKNAYAIAEQKGILMFDMMTERYSLINNIQKTFMQDTLLFGKIQQGTPDHPAIMESSVHHFYRGGRGNRPYWFFDVLQEGEGIVDVTTHLIDIIFWKSFPDEIIDYKKDVKILSASHWPIHITKSEFSLATSLPEIPGALKSYLKDTVLEVFANGSIDYQVKGVCAKVSVEWRSVMPEKGNDLRNAYAKGTKATLFISQKYGQRPRLYVQKGANVSESEFQANLDSAIACLQTDYPGISTSKNMKDTEIVIPQNLKLSRGSIFRVFIDHLVNRDMPDWEMPNTLAKYYITTTALDMAKKE